ncbi:hypothetical protein ACM64Y_18580 [Novispirillum sp. DQ9]|uniref:hypothetical protein n=1 Tax=Novispirillum sp. DQ9 TaxID=3398612 RepID=UPI003C7D3578
MLTAPADWTPTALNGWTDNGDGTFSRTVTGGAFSGDGPTFDAPADSDVDGAFSVVASAVEAENGDTVTASDSTVVAVNAVADPVTVTLDGLGSINEDGDVTPTVTATFGDHTDGSETHTLVLTAPAGWTSTALNGWTDNGDGTFSHTVTGGSFNGPAPTFAAPENANGSVSFSIIATAEETTLSGAEASTADNIATASATLSLDVVAVADDAAVSASGVGVEDRLVPLELSIQTTDSSEVIHAVTLTGLPAGARLWDTQANDGAGAFLPDQASYSLEPGSIGADGSLTRYQMVAPPDASGTFDLTLSVTTREPTSGDTNTVDHDFQVHVFGDADTPTLVADDPDLADTQEPVRSISEDQLVQLTWGAGGLITGASGEAAGGFPASADGSESIKVRIRVPDAAMGDVQVLVDGQPATIGTSPWPDGVDRGAYWEVDGADLAAGKVWVGGAANWADTGNGLRFELTPIATEGDAGATLPGHLSRAETAQGTPTHVTLVIDQETDALTLVADTVGDEDAGSPGIAGDGITVSPSITLQDTDGSESLHGTVEFVFDAADAAAGTLVWIPADPADAGLFTAPGGAGTYTLDSSAFVLNGDTYTIDPSIGRLEFVPTEHWSGEVTYTLRATAIESDGDTRVSEITDASITVTAVADAPDLSTTDGAGMENTAIAFDIDSALIDVDGSETLAVYISDVPKGAVIDGAVPGSLEKLSGSVTLADGTVLTVNGTRDVYRIVLDDNAEAATVLSGLTVTPPANDSADFVMTVHAVTVEPNGSTAVVSDSVRIDVGTNAPAVTTDGAITMNEDSTYTLTAADLSVVNQFAHAGEALSVFIRPVQADGVTPVSTTYVRVQVPNGSGGWKVISPINGEYDISAYMKADGSANVRIETRGHADTDFKLSVRARIEDEDFNNATFHTPESDPTAPDAQEATAVIDVTVRAVADKPGVSGGGAALEDAGWVDMNINVSRSADTDGSETLSAVKLLDVPTDTVLRIPNGDGTYTVLTPDAPGGTTYTFTNPSNTLLNQLKDLEASFPADSNDDISFRVQAISTEHGTDGQVATATSSDTKTVTGKIYGVADAPVLTVDGDTATAGVQDVERTIAEDSFYRVQWGTTTDQTGAGVVIGAQSGEAGSAFGTGTSLDGSETIQYIKIWPADAGDNGIARLAISADGTIDASEVQEVPPAGYWTVSLADLQAGRVHLGAAENWSSANPGDTLSFNMSVVVRENDWNDTSNFAGRAVTAESNIGTITLTVDGRGDMVLIAAENRGVEDAVGGIAVTPTITLTDPDSEVLSGTVQIISDDPDMLAGTLTGPDGAVIVPTPVLSAGGNPTGAYMWEVDAGFFTRNGDTYEIDGLVFQPAPDSSNDVDYVIRATVADSNGHTQTTQGTGRIIVDAVADAPNAAIGAATNGLVTGTEDQPIALNLDVSVSDATLEEIASAQIEGVPDGWRVGYWDGSTFTPADNSGDGVWTLNTDRLDQVAMMPPRDLHILPGDAPTFTLRVVSTETEAPSEVAVQTATTTRTFQVAVQADADTPSLVVTNATGLEDSDIALSILARLGDSDAVRGRDDSESLHIVVDGDFKGGILVDADGNAYTPEADGSYILTPEQAAGVHFRPREHSNEPVSLSVTAVSTEGSNGDTASATTTFQIRVTGVVDDLVIPAGSLDGNGNLLAEGVEDQIINPHFEAYRTEDIDDTATGASSETLSVVLRNIPDGVTVTMTDGNDDYLRYIGDGRWAVDPDHLGDVRLSVPGNFSGTRELTVDLVVTESDGATRTTTKTLVIDVEAVADAPTITITAPAVEDQGAIPVTIAVAVTDTVAGTESAERIVEVRVDFDTAGLGLPDGTTLELELDGQRITVGPGTELVFSENPGPGEFSLADHFVDGQLVGLTLHGLPDHWSTDVPVTVTATSEDANGDQASTTTVGKVAIGVDADAPAVFESTGTTLVDGNTVDLGLDFALTDLDGSETVHFVIGNVPANAVLNHGYPAGNGTWVVPFDPSDSGWTLRLEGEAGIDTTLTVKAVITDRDVDSDAVDVLETSIQVPVVIPGDTGGGGGIDPSVTPPSLSVSIVDGPEDGLFALDITVTPGVGSTPGALVIHAMPGDATLVSNADPGQTAFYQVGDRFIIPLNVDGTIPTNAAGEPVVLVQPPHDMAGPLTLPMSVTATAGYHTVASDDGLPATPEFQVADLTPVSDGAGVSVALGAGADRTEDAGAMPVTITLTRLDTVVDGSEDLAEHLHDGTITISGDSLPAGTVLSIGGVPLVANGDGDYVVAIADLGADATAFETDGAVVLTGLEVTAPPQFHGDIRLTVSVQVADQSAAPVTSEGGLTIRVTPSTETVDSGLIVAAGDVTGNEDTGIALDLTAFNPDARGGASGYGTEVTTVVIKDVPAGAVLSGATNNGSYVGDDGQTYTSWTVKAGNVSADGTVSGVVLTPPLDFSGTIDLTMTVFTMEGSTQVVESTSTAFTVTVEGVADQPSINPQNARGDEDAGVALTLDAELTDASETMEVVIHGVADGARFTDAAGTSVGVEVAVDAQGNVLRNPDGSAQVATTSTGVWVIPGAAVAGLHFVGPANASGLFSMEAQTVAIDGTSIAITDRVPFAVTLDGVADAPELTLPALDPAGTEDQAGGILLNIAAALTDTDGETLSLRLTGLPATADGDTSTLLTADGRVVHSILDADTGLATWVVEGHEIAGLRLLPPQDWNGTVTLGVEARSVEGDTIASTTGTLNVTVDAVNDDPSVAFLGNQTGQSFSGTIDLVRVVPGGDGDAGDGLNILFADARDGGTTLDGLEIRIADGAQPGDRLALHGFDVATDADGTWVVNAGGSSFSMTWDAATKTLAFAGEGSFDTYGELAESVVLVGTDGTLAAGQREITFTATDPDGGTGSASAFTTIDGTVTLTGVPGGPGLVQEIGAEATLTGGAGDDSFVFGLDHAAGGGHTWTIEGAAGNDQLFIFGQGMQAGDWSVMVQDQAAGQFIATDATSGQNLLIDLIDGNATLNTDGPHAELLFQGSGEITFEDGSKIIFDDLEKLTF